MTRSTAIGEARFQPKRKKGLDTVLNFLDSSNDNPVDQSEDTSSGIDENARLLSSLEKLRGRLTIWIERAFDGGPPEPDDVIQQAFANLSQRADLCDKENLSGYVWTTIVNIVRREKRSERIAVAFVDDRRNGIWSDECDEFDPERLLRAREELEIIAQALQDMPERRRKIFIACRFEGLSHAAAAERMGVSRNSATRHIAKATETLVRVLHDCRGSSDYFDQ